MRTQAFKWAMQDPTLTREVGHARTHAAFKHLLVGWSGRWACGQKSPGMRRELEGREETRREEKRLKGGEETEGRRRGDSEEKRRFRGEEDLSVQTRMPAKVCLRERECCVWISACICMLWLRRCLLVRCPLLSRVDALSFTLAE